MKENSNFFLRSLGATSHAIEEREENDYYATSPVAIIELCKVFQFNNKIWEPACGEGHISKELINLGYNVISSDLIDRGYGKSGIDFLSATKKFDGDIVTNPPYKLSEGFIKKGLELIDDGKYVAMFMGIQFLEGKKRKTFFTNNPPKFVYVSSSRVQCSKNGEFDKYKQKSTRCYAWYIWEKGYKGETILRWFN